MLLMAAATGSDEACVRDGDWGDGHNYRCLQDSTYELCVEDGSGYERINHCLEICGADPGCNQVAPDELLDSCDEYGEDFLQDYCNAACQIEDAACDAYSSGCTAAAECDGLMPGEDGCDEFCNSDDPCLEGACGAECSVDADCDDGDPNTVDTCSEYGQCVQESVCGDTFIDPGEECELPYTFDNLYCVQAGQLCFGRQLGTRDTYGYCNSDCLCEEDEFEYACVEDQCDAQCDSDDDCDDDNPRTRDYCDYDCVCEHDCLDGCETDQDCDDSLFCNGEEKCVDGSCLDGEPVDCSDHDIDEIATCDNDPDDNIFTWDYLEGCTSTCDEELDQCSSCEDEIEHSCDTLDCDAPCEADEDCDDGNPDTDDQCMNDCTCYHDGPVCGNNVLDISEECEQPGTFNNHFCDQDMVECDGKRLAVRDAYGDCDAGCGCIEDDYSYVCIEGVCDAVCDSDDDCDDDDPSTADACLESCECVHNPIGDCETDPDCDDGKACNGQEYCEDDVCHEGDPVDCSANDIDEVDECDHDPDDVHYTWDYREGFISECVEPGTCTTGDQSIDHVCDTAECDAQCESDQDCDDYDELTTDFCTDGCVCVHIPDCDCIEDEDCDDGVFCNGAELCIDNQCQDGQDVDCTQYDITPVTTCDHDPDDIHYTWDYREGFISECDEEADECTSCDDIIIHQCSILVCDAQCEYDEDCQSTLCEDGCEGDDYYYYADVPNTCEGCVCTQNECGDPIDIMYDDPRCVQPPCETDDDCDSLDRNYCEGTVIMHDEGICVDSECITNQTAIDDCLDDLFCNGEETCEDSQCVDGDDVDCSDFNIEHVDTCYYSPDDNDHTLDYREGFISYCDEALDGCVLGNESITHTCSILDCQADCDQSSPCEDNACEAVFEDTCVGNKFLDYNGNHLMDNLTIIDSCSRECTADCTCDDCQPDCGTPDVEPECWHTQCGAQCRDNHSCTAHCVGEVFYYDGVCDAEECSCDYLSSQDCDDSDGWYLTNETGWADDICIEREQLMEEYRDYFCGINAAGCDYEVNETRYIDTGQTRFKDNGTSCDDGLFCTVDDICLDGECVSGTDRDCSENDLEIVDSCYIGDEYDYTHDYFPGFISVCDEDNDKCTESDEELYHECSKDKCNAECEIDEECDDGSYRTDDRCADDCTCEYDCRPGYEEVENGIGLKICMTTEYFEPQVWMCDSRVLYDDPLDGQGDFNRIVHRMSNYAFEGEKISYTVLVMDKNGVEKISDVYMTVGCMTNGNIEVECVEERDISWMIDSCNARLGEEELTEFDPDTMRYYTCMLTIETPDSMHGEHWVTTRAESIFGPIGSVDEQEYWFLNPYIAVHIEGEFDLGTVRPGTTAYSPTILVGNDAEDGSGVMMNMFISGTDFYDPSSSGAKCPITNQLRLNNFAYFATNGAYDTFGNPGADAEGYDRIPYGDMASKGESIIGGVSYPANNPFIHGNILVPGSEMAVTLRLDLPEPCVGDFTDGQVFFWGEAI
jgi:hypothetical protein